MWKFTSLVCCHIRNYHLTLVENIWSMSNFGIFIWAVWLLQKNWLILFLLSLNRFAKKTLRCWQQSSRSSSDPSNTSNANTLTRSSALLNCLVWTLHKTRRVRTNASYTTRTLKRLTTLFKTAFRQIIVSWVPQFMDIGG